MSMTLLMKMVSSGAALFLVVGLGLASSTVRPTGPARDSASAAISQHGHSEFPREAANPEHWSGWVDTACSTCHIRYVNANFKVPALNCVNSIIPTNSVDVMAAWAGLDGAYASDPTVEQIGVLETCTSHSAAEYQPFWEMFPDGYHFLDPDLAVPVEPGDSISVSVYYDQSTSTYSFSFQDNTTGAGTVSAPQKCPSDSTCENHTAEVVVENPPPGAPDIDMPDFGSVSFSGTTVTSYDGTKGDLCTGSLWSGSSHQAENVVDGAVLAATGSLTTCSGPDGFAVTYRESQ
jgi:Peptidase A4 family